MVVPHPAFDLRVGQALTSRTYAQLAAVTADLPAGLTAAGPPEPAQPASKRPVLLRPGAVAAMATVLYLPMWALAAVLPRNSDADANDVVNLVGGATRVYIFVLVSACAWAQVLASHREERLAWTAPGRAHGRGTSRTGSSPGRPAGCGNQPPL